MRRLLYTGDRKPRVVAGVEKPGEGDVLPPHTPEIKQFLKKLFRQGTVYKLEFSEIY
jgi:hypothetical protein